MFKYQYKGRETVHIPYLGTFEPGKEYKVEKEINHPDFIEIKIMRDEDFNKLKERQRKKEK